MKSLLTLLIIEDNPAHMADFNSMLAQEISRLPVSLQLIGVRDLEAAMRAFDDHNPDLIMTDVFFPAAPGGDDQEPNGKKIIERCLAEQKPVVWVTSTYHHGKRTDPVSNWGRQRNFEMFDCQGVGDGEAPHKPWREALYGVLYTLVAIEEGRCFFIDGKLKGPEYVDDGRAYRNPFEVNRFEMKDFLNPNKDISRNSVMQKMLELGFQRG